MRRLWRAPVVAPNQDSHRHAAALPTTPDVPMSSTSMAPPAAVALRCSRSSIDFSLSLTSCADCHRSSRILCEAIVYQLLQRHEAYRLKLRDGRRFRGKDRRDQARFRLPRKGRNTRGHLVQDFAEANRSVRRPLLFLPVVPAPYTGMSPRSCPVPSISPVTLSTSSAFLPPMRSRALHLARPKSSSFAPDFVSMMFEGFKSRWITPVRCAFSSASAISSPYRRSIFVGSGPFSSRFSSVSPSTYSRTRYSTPS